MIIYSLSHHNLYLLFVALIYPCSLLSYFSHLSCMFPPLLFQLFHILTVYQLYCQDAFREHNLFLTHDFLTARFVLMFAENFKMTDTLEQRLKSCEAYFLWRFVLQVSHMHNMHIASGTFPDLLIKSTLVQLSFWFPSSQGSAKNSLNFHVFPQSYSPTSQDCWVPLKAAKVLLQANFSRLKGSALSALPDPRRGVPFGVVTFNDEDDRSLPAHHWVWL